MVTQLILKFNNRAWEVNPELSLMDSILREHPGIMAIFRNAHHPCNKHEKRGRQDNPTMEQVVRGALYLRFRQLDYATLAREQFDSRICAEFIGLGAKYFSKSTWHHHISRLSAVHLQDMLAEINRIAIRDGIEPLTKLRTDTTVICADIAYPTNNSLVHDCIREAHRQLDALSAAGLICGKIRNYRKEAKRLYARINTAKAAVRQELFTSALAILRKAINQVKRCIAASYQRGNAQWQTLACLYGRMVKQYHNTVMAEIKGVPVPHARKLFSLYQDSVDLIVKGGREIQFGHKIRVATGTTPLLLVCDVLRGNPSDKKQLMPVLEQIRERYHTIPRDVTADGCYATAENYAAAKEIGCRNMVLHKTNKSMQDIVQSLNLRTRLKNFRAGIEAVISNLKRGFEVSIIREKTIAGFERTVLLSAIAYNIRVLTRLLL